MAGADARPQAGTSRHHDHRQAGRPALHQKPQLHGRPAADTSRRTTIHAHGPLRHGRRKTRTRRPEFFHHKREGETALTRPDARRISVRRMVHRGGRIRFQQARRQGPDPDGQVDTEQHVEHQPGQGQPARQGIHHHHPARHKPGHQVQPDQRRKKFQQQFFLGCGQRRERLRMGKQLLWPARRRDENRQDYASQSEETYKRTCGFHLRAGQCRMGLFAGRGQRRERLRMGIEQLWPARRRDNHSKDYAGQSRETYRPHLRTDQRRRRSFASPGQRRQRLRMGKQHLWQAR